MKSKLLIAILLVLHASFGQAQQDALKVAIAQTGSPRRFVAGDERSQIVVLISNVSEKPERVWQTWNSWGARTITLEVTCLHGDVLGHIFSGQHAWTMNAPTFDTIAPGAVQAFPISVRPPWELGGQGLKNLAKDTWHQVRIRAVFTSKDFEKKGVWTGQLESPFYDFELRIRGNQAVGDDPTLIRPFNPKDAARQMDVPILTRIPDGDYAVSLEWWQKRQALTVTIRNNEVHVIQSNDPLLADMKATLRRDDDGIFFTIFRTKDGQGASQYWIPQRDGSFIIKEVPDRGERQSAIPVPKNR